MEHDISRFLSAGLDALSSDDVKIPASKIEDLANFKEILRAVLSGQLIIASPDRVIPEGLKTPNKEPEPEQESGNS
jgi:hypothetical protein